MSWCKMVGNNRNQELQQKDNVWWRSIITHVVNGHGTQRQKNMKVLGICRIILRRFGNKSGSQMRNSFSSKSVGSEMTWSNDSQLPCAYVSELSWRMFWQSNTSSFSASTNKSKPNFEFWVFTKLKLLPKTSRIQTVSEIKENVTSPLMVIKKVDFVDCILKVERTLGLSAGGLQEKL